MTNRENERKVHQGCKKSAILAKSNFSLMVSKDMIINVNIIVNFSLKVGASSKKDAVLEIPTYITEGSDNMYEDVLFSKRDSYGRFQKKRRQYEEENHFYFISSCDFVWTWTW